MHTETALKAGGCLGFGAHLVALCCSLLPSNLPLAPRSVKEIQAALNTEKKSKFIIPGMC